MKKWIAVMIALTLLVCVAHAECPKIDRADYPRVDGSTATLPLSYRLMEAAAGVDSQTAEALIRHNKTTESFYSLVDGRAELLLVYEPSQDAWDYAKEQGVELEVQSIGYDAPVFLINEGNPVESLTHDQIVGIYTGEITNWSEVGGNDVEIVLIGREAGSGTRDGFESITDTEDACKYRQELTSTGDVITTVAQNPGAIGYASVASVKDTVKAVTVDGVAPTEATIKDGSYVVQRPFVLVTKSDADLSEAAQKFFDYITSADANEIIAAAGVVPVN